MTTATMEKELLDLERQYWDAIKSKDARVAGRLSDEPCVVVGPGGAMSSDRRSMEGMVKDPSYELKSYAMDPKSIQSRAIDKDNAVVAYKVKRSWWLRASRRRWRPTTPRCGPGRTAAGSARCTRNR
jgi:hypothetical protein